MRISFARAFDLTRTRTVRIGGTDYHVPPISFGRFQDLLRLDPELARKTLGSETIEEVAEVLTGLDAIERMSRLDVFPLFEHAAALVPGLEREHWRVATILDVIELFAFFSQEHDWRYVSEAIAFGKPREEDEPTVNMVGLADAMLRLAERLDCSMQELLAMRLEGFYLCIDALKDRKRQAEEEEKDDREARFEGAVAAGEMAVMKLPKGTVTDLDRQAWQLLHPGEALPEEMRPANG